MGAFRRKAGELSPPLRAYDGELPVPEDLSVVGFDDILIA
jgi:hypothetical protein